jgi:hypothetical protein
MKMRLSVVFAMLAVFGAGVILSACSDTPGYHAYGRYSNPNDPKKDQPYDGDWYKSGTD